MQNRSDSKQQALIDSFAKLFAEKIGPEFGYHNLDFSMESLVVVDSCLERVAEVISQLPVKKRTAKRQAVIRAASAYIVKTSTANHQLQSARDGSGQLVMLTPERQGWQVAVDVGRMVEKKLADPANESIVARFMISLFLGEMFGGSNLSG